MCRLIHFVVFTARPRMDKVFRLGISESEKRRREERKAKAHLACERERLELLQCYRTSNLFRLCSAEQEKFWDCFTKVSYSS